MFTQWKWGFLVRSPNGRWREVEVRRRSKEMWTNEVISNVTGIPVPLFPYPWFPFTSPFLSLVFCQQNCVILFWVGWMEGGRDREGGIWTPLAVRWYTTSNILLHSLTVLYILKESCCWGFLFKCLMLLYYSLYYTVFGFSLLRFSLCWNFVESETEHSCEPAKLTQKSATTSPVKF